MEKYITYAVKIQVFFSRTCVFFAGLPMMCCKFRAAAYPHHAPASFAGAVLFGAYYYAASKIKTAKRKISLEKCGGICYIR